MRSALKAERAAALTFNQAAARYIETHEAGWRNAKHTSQWRNTLKTYAYPLIGKLLVRLMSARNKFFRSLNCFGRERLKLQRAFVAVLNPFSIGRLLVAIGTDQTPHVGAGISTSCFRSLPRWHT